MDLLALRGQRRRHPARGLRLHRYHDEDELARFFGLFFGIAQDVTLVILTFITGPLLSRYGIATGMMLRRVALTCCLLVVIIVLHNSACERRLLAGAGSRAG